VQEAHRQALAELAAAGEREYVDDAADRAAAERYYADIDPDVGAVEFFTSLSQLLGTTHRTRPEYRPSVELYPWIDLQSDGRLRSVYTQEVYDPRALIEEASEIEARRQAFRAARRAERAPDARTLEAQVEREEPYNCEHTVPQGWFAHDEPMRGDLHHLFTCERQCNNFRANSPFADYENQLDKIRESCGCSEAAGFEPWAGKGLVARATLYFLLRYPKSLDNRDPQGEYTQESVAMLVGWHDAEPVSEYERHRNAAIFERQGNRNPLIDHPDWASRIAFAEGV
jgi:endonuclease G, mitochondrial